MPRIYSRPDNIRKGNNVVLRALTDADIVMSVEIPDNKVIANTHVIDETGQYRWPIRFAINVASALQMLSDSSLRDRLSKGEFTLVIDTLGQGRAVRHQKGISFIPANSFRLEWKGTSILSANDESGSRNITVRNYDGLRGNRIVAHIHAVSGRRVPYETRIAQLFAIKRNPFDEAVHQDLQTNVILAELKEYEVPAQFIVKGRAEPMETLPLDFKNEVGTLAQQFEDFRITIFGQHETP
jgi:hypothetical protein